MNDPSHRPKDDSQQRLQESKERAADAAASAAQKVQVVANAQANDARDRVEATAAQVRDLAQDKIDEARHIAGQKMDEARTQARDRAETGISSAATGLQDTAHRLRDVAGDLDEKDRWLGTTLEQAAKVAERGGDYLSGQNLNDVVSDAQRTARNNPAAFMGGAAALGFALARLGKVTMDRATPDSRSVGSHPAPTHAPGDKNRTALHGTAPTPAGLTAGTTAPTAGTVTRPTDGRDINTDQSTPLHRSQA